MTENLEPVATPPAASENIVAPVAPVATAGKKSKAGLWAGVLAAVLLAGGGGFAIGSHSGGADRIDRVSFNGPMMGDDQLRQGKGMQPGQGLAPGNGRQGPGFGPHCENTAGDHKAVGPDGTCPSGYTLDQGRGGKQPQPVPSESSSTL